MNKKNNNGDNQMSQAESHGQTHPFHIVSPSPWPAVGSLAVLAITIPAVLYMHGHSLLYILPGFGLFIFTLVGWWRDVIKESLTTDHTREVRVGLRYGMALFILSEVMFFAAFFWAYFHASIFPTAEIGSVWPPKGIHTIEPFDLPYLNTLLLLLSGTTVTWAHFEIMEGNIKGMIEKLGYTVMLGFVFLGVQAFEYVHAPFAFKDGIYPSTFFMATGFHGLHVFIGAVFLLVCWFRARRGHFTADDHFGFEAASWYWHFVDVVWLFLFVIIYWWGAGES
jgi:cytochrome c oxidase subunit 3